MNHVFSSDRDHLETATLWSSRPAVCSQRRVGPLRRGKPLDDCLSDWVPTTLKWPSVNKVPRPVSMHNGPRRRHDGYIMELTALAAALPVKLHAPLDVSI